jgi:hypothetical protein
VGEGKANWYVSLFGSENEPKQLHDFLDSPNCRLVQFKEISTQCYLTACRFSNLTDPKKVCESAKTLLIMIRAFAKIERKGDFQSINIGQGKSIVDNKNATSIVRERVEGTDRWVWPTVPTVTASVNPLEASVSGSVKTSAAEPSECDKRLHDYYLNLCNEEISYDVIDALFYFALPTQWYTLYKAYETIKLAVDGHLCKDEKSKKKPSKIIKLEWVNSATELDNFTYTANHYDADGRHSRLWREHGKKPFSGSLITLSEGEGLVRRLLTKWLG